MPLRIHYLKHYLVPNIVHNKHILTQGFDSIQEQKYEVSHLWLSDLNLPVDAHGIVAQGGKKSLFQIVICLHPSILPCYSNKQKVLYILLITEHSVILPFKPCMCVFSLSCFLLANNIKTEVKKQRWPGPSSPAPPRMSETSHNTSFKSNGNKPKCQNRKFNSKWPTCVFTWYICLPNFVCLCQPESRGSVFFFSRGRYCIQLTQYLCIDVFRAGPSTCLTNLV